jgi:golgi SNAP receptor complex member 2
MYSRIFLLKLFPKCRKLAYDARQQLAQVQNGVLSSPSLVYDSLDELSHQLDLMQQHLVNRETPAQRVVWNRKILELRNDMQSIRHQVERYDQQRNSNLRQLRDREELLTRRRGRGGRNGGSTTNNSNNNEHQDLMHLADEAQSLQQSSLMVDDLLSTGQASLQGLSDQRSRLRGVRKVVSDMANRLGLTNTTMRIIERRDITDAYLVFAGMIVTCVVIYFCYFHFEK